MKRVVISARDVEDAVDGEVAVPEGAIITPLARDLARERGVTLVPAPIATANREPDPLMRSAALAMLAGGGVATGIPTPDGRTPDGPAPGRPAPERHRDEPTPPVKHIRSGDELGRPLARPGASADPDVRTADVVTAADGSPMTAGYMTLTCGTFPWSLTYDEVQIVLEGELHIGTLDGVKVGRPGDILYVPKGSNITFGTPSWTRFAYVTFPADWQG